MYLELLVNTENTFSIQFMKYYKWIHDIFGCFMKINIEYSPEDPTT